MAISGKSSTAPSGAAALDRIAREYVLLCLEIDRIDPGFVDSYVGDPALSRGVAARPRSGPQVLKRRAHTLAEDVRTVAIPSDMRAQSLLRQLLAAEARLRILGGEKVSFDEQLHTIFDLTPPRPFRPAEYEPVLARLDAILPPGPGGLAARYEAFQDRYTIREERVKSCADSIVSDLRGMGRSFLKLPDHEAIEEVRLVSGPSWTAYNWYAGNGRSRVEINKDVPIRAHSLALILAHETYFGHHAEMTLRESELFVGRGWEEYSVVPLYSPQGVVSEGAATAGIHVMLDDESLGLWLARRVFPAAGLPDTLGSPIEIQRLLEVEKIVKEMNGLGCQLAEMLLEDGAPGDSVTALRMKYSLMTREQARRSVRFARDYGGYVCTYGMGERLVAAVCDRAMAADPEGGRDAARRRFRALLSEPTYPDALLRSLSPAAEDGSFGPFP